MRKGSNKNKKLDLSQLKRIFLSTYHQFVQKDYFQENLGYHCVDAGSVSGKLGSDIDAVLIRHLRKEFLWPIDSYLNDYTEEDLFDMIEFTNDIVSKPISGIYHQYSACGWHYDQFDKNAGQVEYRNEVNCILKDYKDGYEISPEGHILTLSQPGFEHLFIASIPTNETRIKERIDVAVLKFRKHGSTLDDRRHAIRDLADILELLRPDAKKILLKKDDSDLFHIANNFGIRHCNQLQTDQYNKPIWYSWMFYIFLSTIHAVLRLIEENSKSKH